MPEEVWIVNPRRCVVPGPCPWTLFELRVCFDALKKDWWSLHDIVSISKEELMEDKTGSGIPVVTSAAKGDKESL